MVSFIGKKGKKKRWNFFTFCSNSRLVLWGKRERKYVEIFSHFTRIHGQFYGEKKILTLKFFHIVKSFARIHGQFYGEKGKEKTLKFFYIVKKFHGQFYGGKKKKKKFFFFRNKSEETRNVAVDFLQRFRLR